MPITELDGTLQLFSLLLIGIGFFSVLMFIMTIVFGISTATFLNNKSGLVAFLLLSLSLPVLIYGIQSRTLTSIKALNSNRPENLQILPMENDQVSISFTTSKESIAYILLESGDITQVILPTYKLEKLNKHDFKIEETIFDAYTVYLVINGEKYPLSNY